ncbi:hypothetical protein Y032_0138g2056 [Ancylostoma ceylanicum]|uniref:Tc3 transposase DNA binding domain-containing protein n=1 Tax=Ancylostoma ceylanicum TaxID=53326 RepID=A0A016T4X9_9BILA|nr:hypothetical protein Y032_0138g2056 [Ancylostoma ceylanicum]
MASFADHTAAVAMHKRGSSVSEVSKTLKLHREQVLWVTGRSGANGGIENHLRGRFHRTARSPALRNAVKSKLRRNSGKSIRPFAKDHKISRSTMRRLIRDDFELYSTNSPKNNASQPK